MKKCSYIFAIHVLLCINSFGQQWVDRIYTYDSLLNVTYGTATNFLGGTDILDMDIFLPVCSPATQSTRRPLLIWIHGGSFLEGSKNDASIQSLCKKFAQRGYVTASISYRLGFISDDNSWACNYPNYACVFAGDSAEWVRSMYRGIQDGKGALRYLINRHEQFKIDTANVFVAGESAGAFLALGIALMDTPDEKPKETFATSSLPLPNQGTRECSYNKGKIFEGTQIPRPDLGSIEGDIEPTNIQYTIKGIGNIFGGMTSDLLKNLPAAKNKPAIYSFHQPCDIIVPIDSANIYWGLSWCFTNGYGCNAIANTNVKIYGARAFTGWNTTSGYGYPTKNEFTTTTFPFSYLLGQGSCVDQLFTPCHAYDNPILRENNLASYFAGLVSTSPVCIGETTSVTNLNIPHFSMYPNPSEKMLHIVPANGLSDPICSYEIIDLNGKVVLSDIRQQHHAPFTISLDAISSKGLFFIKLTTRKEQIHIQKFIKY